MPFPSIGEFSWVLITTPFSFFPPPATKISVDSDEDFDAATLMYISNTSAASRDATAVLAYTFTAAGIQLRVFDLNVSFENWRVYETTGPIVDNGTYQTLPIVFVSKGADAAMGWGEEVRLTTLPAPAPSPPPSQANARYAVRAILRATDGNRQRLIEAKPLLVNDVSRKLVTAPAGGTASVDLGVLASAPGFIALNSDVEGVTWTPPGAGTAEELRPYAFMPSLGTGSAAAVVLLTNPADRDARVEIMWGTE